MITSNIDSTSEETINTTENLGKEIVLEKIEYTYDLENHDDVNYLTYLIIG
jgi:hypothetical protein